MFLIRRDVLKFKGEVEKGSQSFFSGLRLGCKLSFYNIFTVHFWTFKSVFLFACVFVFLLRHVKAALPEWFMLRRSALFFRALTSGLV